MSDDGRFRPFFSVHGMLIRDGKIFLIRRYKTGWRDGEYTCPAGHVEEGESVYDAAIREVREEASVEIEKADLEVVHVLQRRYPQTGERTYVDLFLLVKKWKGEPANAEPDKADDGQWFSLDALPENLLQYHKQAFDLYQKGIHFSEFGFE